MTIAAFCTAKSLKVFVSIEMTGTKQSILARKNNYKKESK